MRRSRHPRCVSFISANGSRFSDVALTSSAGQCPSIASNDQSTAVIRVETPVAQQSSLTSPINSSNGGLHVHPLSTAGGIASPHKSLRYQGNPRRYRRPHRRKRGRHLRQRSELESDHRAAAALAHRLGQEQDDAPSCRSITCRNRVRRTCGISSQHDDRSTPEP